MGLHENLLRGIYAYGKGTCFVGSISGRKIIQILHSGVHVAVETPGRVYDMLHLGSLRPNCTSRCLFLMRRMRCCLEVSWIRIMDISIATSKVTSIEQFYVDINKEDWKLNKMCDLYETCNYSVKVSYLLSVVKRWIGSQTVRARDHTFSTTHGDTDQIIRDIIMTVLIRIFLECS
ncbi:hypothetical protein L7F22_058384 [Adiantum nelumboides]|nr:hypothetical protein [Adiantum nelumboides]